jgi:[citrate (pro-3S)-lyase] ligase
MKRILPRYGISVVEIPRLKTAGKVISATYARKLLAEGRGGELDSYLPQTTQAVLDMNWS